MNPNNGAQISAEIRTNNVIYKCVLEERFYNTNEVKPYSVAQVHNIVPQANGSAQINFSQVLICKNCWEYHKENTSNDGLNLKEPSAIIKPNPGMLPQDFKKKGGR